MEAVAVMDRFGQSAHSHAELLEAYGLTAVSYTHLDVYKRQVETIGVEKGSFYHGEILRAMEDRDAKKARQLMKEHLAATSKGALESLKGKLKK